jgi:hypothetical protein
MSSVSSFMAGLGPAIHETTAVRTLMGDRAKPGHERYRAAGEGAVPE